MPNLPSQWLTEWQAGRIALSDTPPAVQSWARVFVYREAERVLAIEGIEARRKALAKLPDHLRTLVEDEARRLWGLAG